MPMMSAQNLDLALRRGAPPEPPERWILEAMCAAGDEFVTFFNAAERQRRQERPFLPGLGRVVAAPLRGLWLPHLQEQEQGQGLPRLRRPAAGRGG